MKKSHQSAPEKHLNGYSQERFDIANPIPAVKPAVPSKKDPVVAAKKATAKIAKSARRPPRTARGSNPEQLVCRYCGSDDLAPSFITRRDARCRACFKQRYGSAATRAKAPNSPKANAGK